MSGRLTLAGNDPRGWPSTTTCTLVAAVVDGSIAHPATRMPSAFVVTASNAPKGCADQSRHPSDVCCGGFTSDSATTQIWCAPGEIGTVTRKPWAGPHSG